MRPLHIRLLTGPLDGAAGSCVYNLEVAKRLFGLGFEVDVVCLPFFSKPRPEFKTVELNYFKPLPILWNFASLVNEAFMRRQMKRAKLKKPDIVLGFEPLLIRSHAKIYPNTPWIYFPHALDIATEYGPYNSLSLLDKISRWHRTRIQYWALKNASKVVRLSEMGVDFICQRYGLPREWRSKFVVNFPGVTNSAVNTSIRRNTGVVKLLIAGSLIRRKRIDEALRALANINMPEAWQLEITGEGLERNSLEALAQELGLQQQITFCGRIEDISTAYAKADLLLLPSRSEGFGLVIIEAMANGVPVLAFSNEAADTFVVSDEIIQHKKNGFLAHGIEDFTGQLKQIIANPENIRSISEQTRLGARKKYSWNNHTIIYERLFEELANRSTSSSLTLNSHSARPASPTARRSAPRFDHRAIAPNADRSAPPAVESNKPLTARRRHKAQNPNR